MKCLNHKCRKTIDKFVYCMDCVDKIVKDSSDEIKKHLREIYHLRQLKENYLETLILKDKEINELKDKLHRRNMQIKDLKEDCREYIDLLKQHQINPDENLNPYA